MRNYIKNMLLGAPVKNTARRHCVIWRFSDFRNLLYLLPPIRFIAYGSVSDYVQSLFSAPHFPADELNRPNTAV